MGKKLSLVMITKNSDDLLEKSLLSTQNLAHELIIVDSNSTDKTIDIAGKFKAKIFQNPEENLGKKRAFALKKAQHEWVLALDADEIISSSLKKEIKKTIDSSKFDGYLIPYKNHYLGKPINHGGENYQVFRLFKKDKVIVSPLLVHEKYKIKSNRVGCLRSKINHYSYRSLTQIFSKFTDYAQREVKEKIKKGERTSLKKIFLYPIHMFWARYIEDKGYKDGFFRIPLDLGFAYTEFLTYFLLLFYQ